MLYLLLKIFNYNQILLLNQDLISDIRLNLNRIAEQGRISLLTDRDGHILFSLGDEQQKEVEKAIEPVLQIQRKLKNYGDELFGFNLLVSLLPGKPGAVQKIMQQALLLIDDDEEIWLEQRAREFFSKRLKTAKVGDYYRVISQFSSPKLDQDQVKNIWDGEDLVKRVLKEITDRYGEKSSFIFISGSIASERRLLLDSVLRGLPAATAVASVPRLSTLFKRRSLIHPFLNSIEPNFLPEVGRYLNSHELKVWNEVSDILRFLKPGQSPGRSIYPDHLETDFYLAYQLYLTAYFRLMEENLLPALFICEDVELYHSRSVEVLALLLKEFSRNPSFVAVFSSGQKQLPQELGPYKIRKISLRPLSSKRIGDLAAKIFPGLNIPEKDCRLIRRATKGKLNPLLHLLEYLKNRDRIAENNGTYRWLVGEEGSADLPPGPLAVSWRFITTLPEDVLRLLYIIYLQAGLLDRRRLTAFLDSQGLSEEFITRSLIKLVRFGLITYGEYILPLYPAFSKKLKGLVRKREGELVENFFDYIISLWKEGNFRQLVLLFFFLLKMGNEPAASDRQAGGGSAPGSPGAYTIQVLDQLLDRKLGELDFEGVQLILNQSHLRMSAGDLSGHNELPLLLYGARIRAALLAGDMKEAEALYPETTQLVGGFEVNPFKGSLFLQIARFLEMKGETALALDWAKKALIQFQNCQDAGGELRATIEVGSIMMAEGKMEEALEYLSFTEQFPAPSASADELRALALRSIALYLTGNLSLARAVLQRGRNQAGSLKRREWELFLGFLEARVLFDLGYYRDAGGLLQESLALARIYSNAEARKIIYAWLGRTYAYQGLLETAEGLLEVSPESSEKYLFLGEVYYFKGEYSEAAQACKRALTQIRAVEYFPGERVLWKDGFAAVEGRCFSLLSGNALLLRLINSFQAYILGLKGSVELGIEQLHSITRGEKLPDADPYVSIYHYFYACTLPEVRRGEVDDRLTVLNKALKLLQLRASHIEDSLLRFRYLNQNFWNARLLEEARSKKLL
ncbi:hypothetical protein ES703_29309 [subsurface metagenome]